MQRFKNSFGSFPWIPEKRGKLFNFVRFKIPIRKKHLFFRLALPFIVLAFTAPLSDVLCSHRKFAWSSDSTHVIRSNRRYLSPDLTIIFVISPVFSKSDSFNVNKLNKVFQSLNNAHYNCNVALELVILPPEKEANLKVTEAAVSLFSWNHGNFNVRFSSVRGKMESIFSLWIPSRDKSQSVAIIEAALIEKELSPNWYQFIKQAKERFSNRPDILAFSPLAPNLIVQKPEIKLKNDYFLWNGVLDNAIIVPSSESSWISFLNWIQRESGNWHLWPTALNMKGKGDDRWIGFNSTIRASWQLWLSRFCVLYDVYIFYPAQTSIVMNYDTGQLDSRKDVIPKFNIDGSLMEETSVSRISKDTINKILDYSKHTNNVISFTVVNQAYIETAHSWICNVDVGGFRPPGIVWITTDDAAYAAMKRVSNSFAIRTDELKGGVKGTAYGSPGYWLLMLERAILVRDILKQGCSVFLFETDQVWLRNPLPFVKRLVESGENVDLVGTFDAGREIGGNFLFLRPSLEMRKVYSEVCKRFEHEYIRRKVDHSPIDTKVRVPNDQTLLTSLVLYDEPFRSKHPITLRILDMELFACGKWYEKGHSRYSSLKSRSPTIINNNWIRGINKKIERLQQFGHWFWEGNSCNASRVKAAIRDNENRRAEYVQSGQRKSMFVNEQGSQSSSLLTGEDIYAPFSLGMNAIINETRQ